MKNGILVLTCLLLLPSPSSAQIGQGSGAGNGSGGDQATTSSSSSSRTTSTTQDGKATTTTPKVEESPNPRFVRTLTNVQVELTLTDQMGSGPPEKKTVPMIVSSGNWGKIRSSGSVIQIGDAPYGVDLGIDARPFVSTDGAIQLEFTLNYAPPKAAADPREPRQRPTGINQSQTLVLQSGKPMVISQAADPVSDRKVSVEIKATVLK
jgi:hypothetical protein